MKAKNKKGPGWVSSVLMCYEGDPTCACCRFLDGDRSVETLLGVIETLDRELAEEELYARHLLGGLVENKKAGASHGD